MSGANITLSELEQTWAAFLKEWPLERLRVMTLQEYTAAGQASSFTYWIEKRLEDLGSIWGGSSFKFGVYSRADKTLHEDGAGRSYSADYAWMTKYGATPQEAFEKVRSLVVEVAEAAARADYGAIDAVDLGHAYKWKVAFHYQDRERPGVIAVFLRDRLKKWVAARTSLPPAESSKLYQEILDRAEGKNIVEITQAVWKETFIEKTDRWQELVEWGAKFYRQESFDAEERDYKLEIARNLKRAREEFERDGEWIDALKRAFGRPNNLTTWQLNDSFLRWCKEAPAAARAALRCIWDEARSASERFTGFISALPKETFSTPGARISLASFLHMSLDATGYPIYRATPFKTAYGLTGFSHPTKGASEWEVYEHALRFLDRFLEEAAKAELDVRDRLDAQGLIWSITRAGKWEPTFLSPSERASLYEFLCLPAVVTRYWKIAPGENAWQWEECCAQGFIALGWEALGDLRGLSREEFDQYLEVTLKTHPDWGRDGASQAWTFSQIAVGDRIVANRGTRQVIGIGTVTGPYYFEEGVQHGHRIPVRWDDTGVREVEQGGWRRTLIELSADQFNAILALKVAAPPSPPQPPPPPPPIPAKELPEYAELTNISEKVLKRWLLALERKGQAILYGPPGTGKTFVAEHLADYLVSQGAGFKEVLQLHPAYAYEDFIQGIRPRLGAGGALTYEIEDGRFLRFCQRAAKLGDNDICVLILDEINRANLARVFGELMYLLEYRDRSIPLAAGSSLRVPKNVRILGTMNTADRSIALVDHALRRRFAFLELRPDYEILRKSLSSQEASVIVEGLVDTLRAVNQAINDPHYEVGISFFIQKDLAGKLEDIWTMEVLPYLEEYFFDQPDKVKPFAWAKVAAKMLPGN